MRRFMIAGSLALALFFFSAPCPAEIHLSAEQALSSRLRNAHFDDMALSVVVQYLTDLTGADFEVDWKDLAAANVSKEVPITLDMHRVRIGKLLDLVLSQASPDGLLTYYVDDGTIEITTVAIADKEYATL